MNFMGCATPPADPAPLLQALRGQVAALKASRDRLLMELDRQQVELERLANEAAQASEVGCLSGAQ